MRNANPSSPPRRPESLRKQNPTRIHQALWILTAIVGVALSAHDALASGPGLSLRPYAVGADGPADADRLVLSPPPFPLESPRAARLFLNRAMHECAFRVEDPPIWLVNSQGISATAPAQPVSQGSSMLNAPAQASTTSLPQSSFAAPLTASSNLWERAMGVTWYARVDYFYWRESIDSARLLEESGPLVTLGILTQREDHRFRAELFGGEVEYDGQTTTGIPLENHTDYIGFRFQYDLLWPFAHDPNSAFVLGLGTRFWSRKLLDGETASGIPVIGYDETWWMLYPCFGLETRRPMGVNSLWFASASLGVTGFTYEYVDSYDVTLYPKMGPLVQAEAGIQTPRLFLSVFFELMQWYASNTQGDDLIYQPDSMRLTAGLNAGLRF